MELATQKGKKFALKALAQRRANKPKQVDNSSFPAGSPMYFYCKSCGHLSDALPENYLPGPNRPKRLCNECQALKDHGWIMTRERFLEIMKEYNFSDHQIDLMWRSRPSDDLDERLLRLAAREVALKYNLIKE